MSRRRICSRDETFIFSYPPRTLPTPLPPNISSTSFLLSHISVRLILCLSPPPCLSLSSHFSLLITDRDKSSGLLAFSSSSEGKGKKEAEEEEEEGEAEEEEEQHQDKRRKALLSVPLLLLHGAGRTKAFPDRPDHPYLCRADASSPRVLATLPRTLFCFCHNPPCLIRITQFVGISVWCAEEEIARQWLTLSLITLRGCDYMFMCIWVLDADQHVACLCRGDFSEKWAIYRALPRRQGCQVFFECDATIMFARQAQGAPL